MKKPRIILAIAAAIALVTYVDARAQSACEDANFHALDFWIGEWRVFNNEHEVARSVISHDAGDCAIREAFSMPSVDGRAAYFGSSVSGFDSRHGVWRQLYMDSAGHLNVWEGTEVRRGEVVLTAEGRDGATQRMTYRLDPDGAVEQIGEYTTDQGVTWRPGYRYVYRHAE